MPNLKPLKPLLLLAVGFLAAPACSLDPPKFTPPEAGIGPITCTGSGGSKSGGDSGNGSGIDGGGIVTVIPVQCNATNATIRLPYTDGYKPSEDVRAKVKTLLSQMSLADKAKQMRGMPYGTAGKTQMSDTQRSQDTKTIRGYHYRDASRGMNLAEDMAGTKPNAGYAPGTKTKVGWATAFPVSMARGAAFDLDIEYAIGEAIADEMMAAKETLLLAPCMNILRQPLWGRAQETYGEDAFHIGRLATAMTVGVQQHITANAKHYMAYDIENGRDFNDMTLDEQTLREIYGRHFRMVVQDGGVGSVMAAYNQVNGIKSVASKHILTDVLRTDFGFQGFVLSDWWAMHPQTKVGTDITTLKRYAKEGMDAGLDVELPWSLNYAFLENLVDTGDIAKEKIDLGASRVLEQKLRFDSLDLSKGTWGLGTPKTSYAKGRVVYGCEDGHIDLARKAAVESMVLLKNKDNTLPIKSSVQKVAVLGATVPYKTMNGAMAYTNINFATDVHTGDMGSSRVFSDPELSVGPFKGIKNTMEKLGLNTDADHIWSGGSAADARDADFVVVIAGLTAEDEGEEYTKAGDRFSFALDAKQPDTDIQNKLIREVAALGKPMVVILEGSSIIDMPWLEQVPAVVMAWYAGMVGGDAMGMLLWGQANFSGKLPFTWGKLGDYPVLKGEGGATYADYWLGYRRFDKESISPIFPFGYGLSYTSYAYSNLQIGCTDMSEGAVLPVYVNVKNTGSVAGDEIVMLWVSFPNSKASRRTTIKELKGFARVSLNADEEKQVMIPVRLKDLDYYDQDKGKWVVEDGEIKIMVGGNSTDFTQMKTVMVHGYEKDSSNY
jgi:beta-glucosidase